MDTVSLLVQIEYLTARNDKLEDAISRIHDIAKDYFADTCGDCQEAAQILGIIGEITS